VSWPATTTMLVLDAIVIGLVLAMIGMTWSLGIFRKRRMPRIGRFLMIAGVSLTGLFHLADLSLSTVLPPLLPPGKAAVLLTNLHLGLRWPVLLLSLLLIAAGVVVEAYLRERLEIHLRQVESRITTAQDAIVESEIRFRSLVERTTGSLYCFELTPPLPIDSPIEDLLARSYDAILVQCNQAFAESLEAHSAEEVVGMRFGEMDSALDTDSHTRLFTDFAEQGYRLVDYELQYSGPAGEPRALHLNLSGVTRNGKLRRIWGSERNVIQEYETKAALATRLHFHWIIADISSQLLMANNNDTNKLLKRCLQQAGHYVQASRVAIMCFAQSGHPLREQYFWSKLDDSPWPAWSQYDVPWMWPKLLRGEPIGIANVSKFTLVANQDAKSLTQMGVQAAITVPILAAGKPMGACVFADSIKRPEWSEQEVDDLNVIANLFASKLVQMETDKALNEALSKLRIAKNQLDGESDVLAEGSWKSLVS
jgi:PAS domain-containing protein